MFMVENLKPLKHIYNMSSIPSARKERWVLRLQGYNFKVICRPGKTNIADALSCKAKFYRSERSQWRGS